MRRLILTILFCFIACNVWAAATVNDANCTVLIQSVGKSDGDTDFADNAIGGTTDTITADGNTHHEVDQAKFPTTSIYFDGSGDALHITDSADVQFDDIYTIDCWVYNPVSTVQANLFGSTNTGAGKRSIYVAWRIDDTFYFGLSSAGTSWASENYSTSSAPTGEWVHLAITSDGTTVRFFINGTVDATTASAVDLYDTGLDFYVAGYEATRLTNNAIYIEEFRISDTCRWTTSFTPPDAPYGESPVAANAHVIITELN